MSESFRFWWIMNKSGKIRLKFILNLNIFYFNDFKNLKHVSNAPYLKHKVYHHRDFFFVCKLFHLLRTLLKHKILINYIHFSFNPNLMDKVHKQLHQRCQSIVLRWKQRKKVSTLIIQLDGEFSFQFVFRRTTRKCKKMRMKRKGEQKQ